MFGNRFGLDFYDNPFYYNKGGYYNYPGQRLYGYQPDYTAHHGYHGPFTEVSPSVHSGYGMPVEIPVIHEGSSASSAASDESMAESKKAKILEEVRPPSREEKKSSPQHHNKVQSAKPYSVKQVPMQDMNSEDICDNYDDDDDDDSQFYGTSAHGFPFQGYYPFHPTNSRPQPSGRTMSRRPVVKSEPKVINIPIEKTVAKEKMSPPSLAAKPPKNYKSQTIPISMERLDEVRPPPFKRVVTPMEQLENIQKEMENILTRVENFSGEKRDKEYIFLDETMTSLLLKLDSIESNGIEEIRTKRRLLVREIQGCLQKLEQKVGIIPVNEETTVEEMEEEDIRDEEFCNTEMVPPVYDNCEDGQVSEKTSSMEQSCHQTEERLGIEADDATSCLEHKNLEQIKAMSDNLVSTELDSVNQNTMTEAKLDMGGGSKCDDSEEMEERTGKEEDSIKEGNTDGLNLTEGQQDNCNGQVIDSCS